MEELTEMEKAAESLMLAAKKFYEQQRDARLAREVRQAEKPGCPTRFRAT